MALISLCYVPDLPIGDEPWTLGLYNKHNGGS